MKRDREATTTRGCHLGYTDTLCKLFILISFFNKFCSDSDEPPQPTEPLIDVIEGGMYTGQSLANLIRSLREILESNVPAEEFKVSTRFE